MGWSSLCTLVIAGGVNPTTRRPTSLWPNSNRIMLPGFDITDQAKFDTDQKIEKASYTALLRGRHLEGAVLCGANLGKGRLHRRYARRGTAQPCPPSRCVAR